MDDFQRHLEALDAESAHHIRDSASRAGLQAHDPAARMIAEMWVAVAALKQERQLLSGEMAELSQRVRQNHRILLMLAAIGAVNLLMLLAFLVT